MTPKPNTAVVVVGSINVDLIFALSSHALTPGSTVPATFTLRQGGKGANAACASGHFGAETIMVGSVGTDDYGDTAVEALEGHGVQCYISRNQHRPTGVAGIMTARDGENLIGVDLGANLALIDTEVVEALDSIAQHHSRLIVVTNFEVPESVALAIAGFASRTDTCLIIDPAPSPKSSDGIKACMRADILTPNETEALFLLGHESFDLHQFLSQDGVFLTTKGEEGLSLRSGEVVSHFPASQVDTVDTVGAGDCFVGVLAAALASELDLEASIRLATFAASQSTTKAGAREGLMTYDELLDATRRQT